MQLEAIATLLIFTLATVCSFEHDDLIIAVGDKIELLIDWKTYRTLTLDSYNASKISALAYDPTSKKLFFSDVRHLHGHIFSVNLNDELSHPVDDILEKKDDGTVGSLTYDPIDQMLLWTDRFNRSIRRVHIEDETFHAKKKIDVDIVHSFGHTNKPGGLVCDPCTRMLYWTNIHESRPAIERSFLNGSHPEVLVEGDLFQPMALDLDVPEQRLYWVDSLRNGSFYIGTSFVNGTGRQEIYRGLDQIIISLAVGDDYLYWGDYTRRKLWSLRKDGSSSSPLTLGTFRNPPMSILVLHRQSLNCNLLSTPPTETLSYKLDTVITVCLTITCLVIIGSTVICFLRIRMFRGGRPFLVSNTNEDVLPFQDFDNYSNSLRMCERTTQEDDAKTI